MCRYAVGRIFVGMESSGLKLEIAKLCKVGHEGRKKGAVSPTSFPK